MLLCVLCSLNLPAELVTSSAAIQLHHTLDCHIIFMLELQSGLQGTHIIHSKYIAAAALSASRKVTEKRLSGFGEVPNYELSCAAAE